ncbi:uncharacterized protein PHACADRAFT_133462 [Phanerochaete carnosa HHB-10118-sp]|uniref:Major facilitator superfamily (MFS) profile domain-containing protein n=1 Tax=Phanerochaete carnosa (strain HHB-10118-sp) TaxID=650164 RepID=K5WMQ2_PHACS|nr:uncharacterized protein PHACADRAFT_133462 [Phanerochaete carnosa HHB-10118-sp]EKM60730.1 hypothetical protein PHACADRAFT_133462 [Phanerochaete carnosa HHB-10118-sp]
MSGEQRSKPWGLRWRSSVWYVTFGVMTDVLVYSIVIPVLPFQLERLGYQGVSGRVGWLLFGFSAGLVLSTVPIAMFSERYNMRTWPLILGQVILIGSQIMLMLAPTYWLMVLARIIQGISSSIIWIVGLALLCDTASESIVGRQLGVAMTGLSLGSLIGPLAGGLLYHRFGFHGPGILAVILAAVDLVGRLLIIERKDALKYGVDPAAEPEPDDSEQTAQQENPVPETRAEDDKSATGERAMQLPDRPQLSLIAVVRKLATSKRALTVMFGSAIYGRVQTSVSPIIHADLDRSVAYASQEPALPLHLQAVWNFDSSRVGLIYLGGVIPTLISSPLSGWITDWYGSEWTLSISFLLILPWFGLLTINGPLALFIAMFCLENFFLAATVPPLTTELAAVSRMHEGIGYAHVYGAFNLSFGIGSARTSSTLAYIYDHVRQGWAAICYVSIGVLAMCSLLSMCFVGDKPLYSRLLIRRQSRS